MLENLNEIVKAEAEKYGIAPGFQFDSFVAAYKILSSGSASKPPGLNQIGTRSNQSSYQIGGCKPGRTTKKPANKQTGFNV